MGVSMIMVKRVIINCICSFALITNCIAGIANINTSSDLKQYQVKWHQNVGVQKKYSTPLGSLYKFTPLRLFEDSFQLNLNEKTIKLPSIKFNLFRNTKEQRQLKRYIAVDFKLRLFPAVDKNTSTDIKLIVIASEKNAQSLNTNKDIIFQSVEESAFTASGRHLYFNTPLIIYPLKYTVGLFSKEKKLLNGLYSVDDTAGIIGKITLHPYKVVNIRYIFDTQMGLQRELKRINNNFNKINFCSASVNDKVIVFPNNYILNEDTKKFTLRSLGLCMVLDKRDLRAKIREYIEISTPVITITNNLEDLRKLPVNNITDYPYSKFNLKNELYCSGKQFQKIKKSRRNICVCSKFFKRRRFNFRSKATRTYSQKGGACSCYVPARIMLLVWLWG